MSPATYPEPAFPVRDPQGNVYSGMEMRDWLAGQALQGVIITCAGDTRAREIGHAAYYAERSYEIADAMMIARKVGQ